MVAAAAPPVKPWFGLIDIIFLHVVVGWARHGAAPVIVSADRQRLGEMPRTADELAVKTAQTVCSSTHRLVVWGVRRVPLFRPEL